MITPLPEAVTHGAETDAATTKVRRFARRWWWVGILAVLLVTLAVYNATRQDDTRFLGIGNPGPQGGMALANILEDQGVSIVSATAVSQLEELADGDTTVFLLGWDTLDDDEREAISGIDADVVIAGSPYGTLDGLTAAVENSPYGTTTSIAAQCSDPDATAAARISPSRGAVTAVDANAVEICFPSQDDAGLYAAWEQAGHHWRYIADVSIGTNRTLADDGNAALMLRALGGNERLVWFEHVITPESVIGGTASDLPPWGEPALAIGVLAIFAAALWQGRRMGRVVIEPLPVVVLPGEAVRGRARLYRSSKSVAHAAASLRAGTVSRITTRLGLGSATSPQTIINAVAQSSGRPYDHVGPLLYGQPPANETELVRLANDLTALEREVHP